MVEIKKILRRSLLFAGVCAALVAAEGLRAQKVESRIAGLEGNAEYMSLLRQDAVLRIREDSIVNAVERVRQQLREDPDQRQRYAQEILGLESKIFELRNAKGRLIDRINTIEQDWVLANLNSATRPVVQDAGPSAPEIPDSLKVRNLVDNLYFRERLEAADYAALVKAQQMERQAANYATRYVANYGTIADLAAAYAAAQNETEALEYFDKYNTLQGINRVLADSLATTWNYIFDNKSYAYGYLLDALDKEEILAKEEEQLAAAARRLAAVRDEVASEQLADYFLRKKVMADYETAVAGVLKLDAARDSLRGVSAQAETVDYRLPKVAVQERTFIAYDSITFPNPPRYSYQHPIPECREYARGTIYRILLGRFNTKRAVSTFRGADPLCYRIDDEGKWCYYAGGFATREEADAAQKLLKSKGFLRPEVVVWIDGVYRNLSKDTDAPAMLYRVEIVGAEALPDAVKEAIAATAEGHELSRGGQQMYVVGMFDDKGLADRVAAAVQQADPALEIKVAEISE